jgi:hypothetical protein
MYEYKRPKYWAEWIALIKKLESDPLGKPGYEPSLPAAVKYIRNPRPPFAPANPVVFQSRKVAKTADGSKDENENNCMDLLQLEHVYTEAAAKERLKSSPARETRACNRRDWPDADSGDYVDGMHDQTRRAGIKSNTPGFICRIDRDSQAVKLDAAKTRLQDAEVYQNRRVPVIVRQSGPFARKKPFRTSKSIIDQTNLAHGPAVRLIESLSLEQQLKLERKAEVSKALDGNFVTIKKVANRPGAPIAELWSETRPDDFTRGGIQFGISRPLGQNQLDKCYALMHD